MQPNEVESNPKAKVQRYINFLDFYKIKDQIKAQEWLDLLVSSCNDEKNWDIAFTKFLDFISQEGLEIEIPQKSIEDTMSRLFEIQFVRKAINAMGLMEYEKDILQYEIQKRFAPGGGLNVPRAITIPSGNPQPQKGGTGES